MANNSGTACSTIEEMRESNRALIILSATLGRGGFHIRPRTGQIWNLPLQFGPNDHQDLQSY